MLSVKMGNKEELWRLTSYCKHAYRSEKYSDMNYCSMYCKFLDKKHQTCDFCEYFKDKRINK